MKTGKIQVAKADGVYTLKFIGDVRLTLCNALDTFLEQMYSDADFKSVLIDLTETEGIDSTSLGLLAKLSIQAKKRFSHVPKIVSSNNDITRILLSMGFDRVFNLSEVSEECCSSYEDIACSDCSEQVVKEHVLDAHRVLMSLNEANQDTFHNFVKTLEKSNKTAG